MGTDGESGVDSDFKAFSAQLDAVNERRERIIKASRDVTIHSKRVIFQLHRANPMTLSSILANAADDLRTVRTAHISRIAQELQGGDYWRHRKAYTIGIQEYVEAATFLHYLKERSLMSLSQINESFASLEDAAGKPFRASLEDYLLGVLDLTGELMRLAIGGVASGQRQVAGEVRLFLQELYACFCTLPRSTDISRDMGKKLEVMLQSLVKVEAASYTLHVRGSEYPEEMLAMRLELEGADGGGDNYGQ
eukprot:TRINITY_DN4775_c0_g1_i1.p1 TRINITY_DN4775_c0_g1~~TRINITY_DN4775_c0_g1_i1.p1  ORF type:complete len:250 (-),score=56.88 TRINITY_DN4775_c0_g1_i1:565-1314(-)